MRRVFLTAAMLLCAVAIYAQTTSPLPCSSNCSLAKNQSFSVVYDWTPTTTNPEAADGFRLYQNGAMVRESGISALQNGTVVFNFSTGLATAGSYSFAVSAFTTGGETVGDPIAVTILKGKPAKPTNGRLQ